jgi:hypothetical protein
MTTASSVPMPATVRLALHFDAAALLTDVDALDDACWLPHFNTAYYSGDWSGVPLRAVGGRSDRLFTDPADRSPVADSPVLGRCPALRAALERLECATTSARLLRLGAGARVREHDDNRLGYEDGEVRLHIPLRTGPGAEFILDGREVHMAPGECWYVNVNRPHRVANTGPDARVHLVVDCVINAWLDAMLTFEARGTPI